MNPYRYLIIGLVITMGRKFLKFPTLGWSLLRATSLPSRCFSMSSFSQKSSCENRLAMLNFLKHV